MATGVGFGFDTSFLDALKRADKELDIIMQRSKNMSSNLTRDFISMAKNGVIPFAESLKQQKKMLEEIGNIKVVGKNEVFERIQKDAAKTVDDINKVIKALEKTKGYRNEASGKSAITYANKILGTRGDKSIDNLRNALRQLEAAQNRQNLNTKTGRKNYEKLAQSITRVKDEIDKVTGASDNLNQSHRKLIDIGGQLMISMAAMFSVSAIKGYVNQLMKIRGEFELQQRSLQILLQNKAEANALWQKTVQLAVKSPFTTKELVTYTKQLAAYRIESDKLYETNKMLADVSAGLGVDMNRLILAYGQVKAANFLRGTELRQFSEAGVNLLDELADRFTKLEGRTVSVGEVFDRVSKRMVTFKDVEAVFKKITSEGGIFYQMQEKQSETLQGSIMNLRDSYELMLNEIGKANQGTLKFGVNVARSLIENVNAATTALKAIVAVLAVYKLQAVASSVETLRLARSFGIMAGSRGALSFLQLLQVGLKSVGKTLSGLWNTLKANPWVAAIAIALEGFMRIMDAANEHSKQIEDIKNQYEELSKKVSKISIDFKLAKGIDKKKGELKKLVETASEDFYMNVEVDFENIKEEEAVRKFEEIRERMENLSVAAKGVSESFANTGSVLSNAFTDSISKDLQQLQDEAAKTRDVFVSKIDDILPLLEKFGLLTEEIKESFSPQKIDESDFAYFTRLQNAYKDTLDKLRVGTDARYTINEKLGKEAAEGIFKPLNNALTSYNKKWKEATSEIASFIEKIKLSESMSDEDKTIAIKIAIDRLAAQYEWGSFTKEFVAKQEALPVKIDFEYVGKREKPLDNWKEEYNKFVEKLSTGVVDKMGAETDEEQYISLIKGTYKRVQKEIKAYEAGNAKLRSQYSSKEIERLKAENEERKKAIDWLVYEEKSNKEKAKDAKILSNRINLIKDLNKTYTELTKTFDKRRAEEKVSESFKDTFKEAFEDTGINLTGLVVDKAELSRLQKAGETAGKVFSESMKQEMTKMAEEGAYIRNFTEDTLELIKKNESVLLKATDVEKKGRGLTIGYGEYRTYKDTGKKILSTDVMTEEQAAKRLAEVVLPKYRDELNKILDTNNDLIFTQEQYNALLDLTYQGGAGSVKKLINLAKDEAAALEHINAIQQKISTNIGTKDAERFGQSFISKLKESESVYERIALLLQTMNLTIDGGKVEASLYKGMQKRSDERASMFSGDLEIVELLQKAAIDVSQIDFTNIKGVIETLKKLQPIAKKEGKEAEQILSKAISELEAKVGVDVAVKEQKELQRSIESMFGNYEVSLELEKLNIPPDLAQSLFGVSSVSLEEIRKKIEGELSKIKMSGGNENLHKDLEQSLKRVTELERKELEARLKRYSEFLMKGKSEAVKLKIEELREIAQLEEDFNNKKIGETDYNLAKKGIQDEYKAKQDKLVWEEFAGSETFIKMFEDLDKVSTSSVRNMIERIENLKGSLSDLDPQSVKELIDALERLKDEDATRNPFKQIGDNAKEFAQWLTQARQNLEELKKAEDDAKMWASDADKKGEAYAKAQAEYERISKDKSSSKKQIEAARIAADKAKEAYAFSKQQAESAKEMEESARNTADNLREGAIKFAEGIAGAGKDIQAYTDAISELIGHFDSSLGESAANLGVGLSSIFSGAGGLASGIATMNPLQMIQGLSSVVGGVMKIKNAITQMVDKKRERQIKAEEEKVEKLQKAYEKLEEAIEKAYTIDDLQANTQAALDNLQEQIESRQRQLELEKEKKKSDADAIAKYNEEIEELNKQREEVVKQNVENMGGTYDFKSITRDFVDAWAEAFNETGNGLKGLEDSFDDFFMNIVRNQVVMGGASKILEPLINQINESLKGDYTIDKGEEAIIDKESDRVMELLNDYLETMYAKYGEKLTGAAEGGELSGAQKGIQGVSEQTADIIAGYLNSIRSIIMEQKNSVLDIASKIGNSEMQNPIVEQLRLLVAQTTSINSILSSVHFTDSSGTRLRVSID